MIKMKVNHKHMYLLLNQQVKALEKQLSPESETVNEIPENFNQVGWDLTIDKVEELLVKMKEIRKNKGKRLTPQFYRSIYNRALIGMNEIDKLNESLVVNDEDIDYENESTKLMILIQELTTKVESIKAAEKAEAEEKAKAAIEESNTDEVVQP